MQHVRYPEHHAYVVVCDGEPWDVYQLEGEDGPWTIGLNPNRHDGGASVFAAQGRWDQVEFVTALARRPRFGGPL